MWASYSSLVDEADAADEHLDDLQDACREVDSALDEFNRRLVAASAEADARVAVSTLLSAAVAAGDAAQRLCRDLRLELSGAPPGDEAAALRRQSDEQARRLERQLGTLTFLRATRQREALLAGAKGADATDARSPSDLIALGLKVQVESAQAVSRMTRVVESTKQVGATTLQALHGHRTRLEGVRASVAAQAYQFAQAERELTEYADQALGDSARRGRGTMRRPWARSRALRAALLARPVIDGSSLPLARADVTLGLLLAIVMALVALVLYRVTVGDAAAHTASPRWATEVFSAFDARL